MRMRPIFKRKGSKWRSARRYPAPIYNTVIEPFAGGAGYSLWYEPDRVRLFDVEPKIEAIWDYVLRGDLEQLPRSLTAGADIRDMHMPRGCEELVRSTLFPGGGANTVPPGDRIEHFSVRGESKWASVRESILKVREGDWDFQRMSFEELNNIEATWFIDPPYQHFHAANKAYKFDPIDYTKLADWVLSRRGQVIVCEGEGADWLPFRELFVDRAGASHNVNAELIFVKESP